MAQALGQNNEKQIDRGSNLKLNIDFNIGKKIFLGISL